MPEGVANQIAAGEVVERPVAVVKELVENALDAGARQIEVEFRKGGKTYMRVTDDGCGMDRQDAQTALERHATSKIEKAQDLQRILSFGFRGEALPSIASVSRFRLRTRLRGTSLGTEIVVEGTGAPRIADAGMPEGTVIEVAQLFHTVPVRRKFMKTDRTEAAHIIQLCRVIAVAHPEVAFTLIEDGREVFRSPVCAHLEDRVGEVFGRALVREIMPIEAVEEASAWKVHGLVSQPGRGRTTRAEMLCYVNRRPVDSRLLNYALIESFHTYLARGRYPAAFLFLKIPPAEVDVNIHPAKREIRFRDEGRVRRFVMEALLEHLRAASRGALPQAKPVDPVVPPKPLASSPVQGQPVRRAPGAPTERPAPRTVPSTAGSAVPDCRDGVAGANQPPLPRSAPVAKPEPSPSPRQGSMAAPRAAESGEGIRAWRFIGFLEDRFVLWESPEGLVILHYAAAWERIRFEEILRTFQSADAVRQGLLFPLLLEVDPLSADTLTQVIPIVARMGFDLEPFGRDVFRLSAVPDWFTPEQAESFIREGIRLLREQGRNWKEDAVSVEMAKLAARRAVHGLPAKDPQSARALLARLFACRDPLVDPRGRATFFEARMSDIERRLGL